jgi:hypothetical protein
MGFRLLVMSIVAAAVCLLSTVSLLALLRRSGGRCSMRLAAGQTIVGAFMVGVLYILAAYAVGYVGYRGTWNAAWLVGIPMMVAFIQTPRLPHAFLWIFPLLVGGWLCMGVLSMTVGIPLD